MTVSTVNVIGVQVGFNPLKKLIQQDWEWSGEVLEVTVSSLSFTTRQLYCRGYCQGRILPLRVLAERVQPCKSGLARRSQYVSAPQNLPVGLVS